VRANVQCCAFACSVEIRLVNRHKFGFPADMMIFCHINAMNTQWKAQLSSKLSVWAHVDVTIVEHCRGGLQGRTIDSASFELVCSPFWRIRHIFSHVLAFKKVSLNEISVSREAYTHAHTRTKEGQHRAPRV
jgi:hypothetical protein